MSFLMDQINGGLSPRLRGNHLNREHCRTRRGSIPAPAGEPSPRLNVKCRAPVYPRACGGTRDTEAKVVAVGGLSPRLRGNHSASVSCGTTERSIPAPAGEPSPPTTGSCSEWVYPRACGGTSFHLFNYTIIYGLSPRLRGNPRHGGMCRLGMRSIPAPAGEPYSEELQHKPSGVYPRACGEPSWKRGGMVFIRVYPRACGGTWLSTSGISSLRGLSPRLRGNPRLAVPHFGHLRSIPAPAGEPKAFRHTPTGSGVYPRACGGTHPRWRSVKSITGLSPRLRGNRLRIGTRV